jgi:alpha-mannosidase
MMNETSNHLLQLVPGRIQKLRARLGDLLWSDTNPLCVLGGPVNDTFLTLDAGMQQTLREVRPGEWFGQPGGGWQQRWFRIDVPAPGPDETGRRYLHWDCNGETTAYLDGTAYAGLDIAHTYFRLPDRDCTLWLDCGTYQSCLWHPGRPITRDGLRFLGAHTAVRNETAWKVFWDLDVLGQWMEFLLRRDGLESIHKPQGVLPEIREVDPVLRRALYLLNRAHAAWELEGLDALAAAADGIYAEFPAEPWQMQATFTGHSHLDLVWLWPEEIGERKTVHTMANACRLMEDYPDFRFLWVPPISYDVVGQRDPGLLKRVREAMAAGRWEATGGAWVETDTLMMSGEALARALVLGQRAFEAVRGERSRVFWLPDSFGFSINLPQLMRLAGLDYFATMKLSWSPLTDFPHHTFHWRAPDGSSVITHNYLPFFTGDFTGTLVNMAQAYRQSDVNRELLSYAGVGDGGGGTTIAAIEQMQRLENLACVPRTRWGSVEDWFERIAGLSDALPVYDGELYLEIHRGVHTSQAAFKDTFRALERALQAWEALRAVTGGDPVPDDPWKRLAFAQFHDILPGSSLRLAYEQLGPELSQQAADIAAQTRHELEAWADVETDAQAITVFNPVPVDRQAVITLPDGQPVHLTLQALETLAVSPDAPRTENSSQWTVSERVLDNGVIRAEFDEQGRLAAVQDANGAWPLGGPCEFVLHPDRAPSGEAWEIDQTSLSRIIDRADTMTLSVVSDGPVRAILRGESPIGDNSRLRIDYILDRNADCLRIEAHVDWFENGRLLKFRVPGNLRAANAWYGAPYGVVARSQAPVSLREEAMWEVPATCWAAAPNDSGTDGMLMLFDRARGVSCRHGELGLSLLRAPRYPNAEALHSGDVPDPNPDELGDHMHHVVRLALARFKGLAGDRGAPPPAAQADALFAPLVTTPGRARRPAPPPFRISGLPSVAPSWVLPASGGGYIIRLVESGGCRGRIGITFATPPDSVQPVNLLEDGLGPVEQAKGEETHFECEIGPYQVLSLLVK